MGFLCCGQLSSTVSVHGGGSSRAKILAAPLPHHNPKHSLSFTSPFFNNFRSQHALGLRMRRKLVTVFSSNTNSAGEDSSKENSSKIGTSDTTQGPPLLTILAGFTVFVGICWMFGSIIMWIVGLIVK